MKINLLKKTSDDHSRKTETGTYDPNSNIAGFNERLEISVFNVSDIKFFIMEIFEIDDVLKKTTSIAKKLFEIDENTLSNLVNFYIADIGMI